MKEKHEKLGWLESAWADGIPSWRVDDALEEAYNIALFDIEELIEYDTTADDVILAIAGLRINLSNPRLPLGKSKWIERG